MTQSVGPANRYRALELMGSVIILEIMKTLFVVRMLRK